MADIIINGTTVRVSSGVVSSGLHVTSDGEVTVLDGGVVTDAEATRYGFFWVEEGGFLQNTFLHDSGEAFVSGGSAANLTMQSGGQANIMSGLFSSGTVLDGGVGVIYTTASGYDVAVSTGGRYLVYGGYAENTRVASGGSFTIQLSGGLASDTTVEAGGTARIVSGAVASKNMLNGGRMEVLMGMADEVTIQNGGHLKVHAAGEAQTITVRDGLLEVETGTVYDTFLSGGSADLRKGAAFRFNQFGGSADVMSGTVITGGTLAGGVMT
ncbi:MAG: AIDA repeat-containing protein, partial [Lentisphaeria bacterium]|nr:AIDA repeat-containing protein [Lentisphaeria bacterium]